MLTNCVYQRQYIEQLGKVYYCPLTDNRQVDDSGGAASYLLSDYMRQQVKSPAVTMILV